MRKNKVNKKMSIAELTLSIKKETEKIKSLPPEEAKKRALSFLVSAGIVNKNGKLTERYSSSIPDNK
jgi:hypothetical protein